MTVTITHVIGDSFDFSDEATLQKFGVLRSIEEQNKRSEEVDRQIADLEKVLEALEPNTEGWTTINDKINRLQNKKLKWELKAQELYTPEKLVEEIIRLGFSIYNFKEHGKDGATDYSDLIVGVEIATAEIASDSDYKYVLGEPDLVISAMKSARNKFRRHFGEEPEWLEIKTTK